MAVHFTVADLTADPEWDDAVWRLPRANVFASRSWGTYKAKIGWDVRRVAIRCAEAQDMAYVQVQQKSHGLGRFFHVQGSPVFTPRGERRAEGVLRAFLDHLDLGRFDLVGVSYQCFQTAEASLALLCQGFLPIVTPKAHTLHLDLTQDMETIRAGMQKNWRGPLARAERNPELESVFLTDPAERLRAFDAFSRMYGALKERKGFRNTLDTDAYRDVAAADPNLLFLEVRENGEPILVRIAHRSPERLTDFFVASTERAQATGAARLSVWRMIERARAEGCRVFDLGGIDPSGNAGVFEFKRGLGRTDVASDPLWLFGPNRLVRHGAATVLAWR